MFNNYESIAEAIKTMNMIINLIFLFESRLGTYFVKNYMLCTI